MNDTPHQTTDTPRTDQVPGVPPVPITVWRTPAAGSGDSISTRLAYRLVAAYSQPGETIIDLTDGDTIGQIAQAGGRIHRHATCQPGGTIARPPAKPRPPGAELATIARWFRDDYPGQPTVPATTSTPSATAAATLVVAGRPSIPADLMAAAAQLLRPGGCLVIIASANAATPADCDFTPLIDGAGGAGLRYLQHIIAVGADVDADQFVYYASEGDLVHAAGHAKIHTDLLVFTAPEASTDA